MRRGWRIASWVTEMSQWLTIWRAAQLVGVSRGALQQRVRAGEIGLTDGLVSTETLLQLYPQAELESSGMLERVVRIRDDAFGQRVRERLLPSQEVLALRLFRQSQELADVQRHLQRYHALVIALREQLQDRLAQTGGDDPALLALQGQLNDGLARALATESVDVLDAMDDALKVVAAQVTLRPSGHQFAVEGHDTLLQAGLRAGLNLNYGCGNGSCGMCKVRVISGEVTRTMPCDYPLSEAEKQQGYTLLCAHTAASSEVMIETLEAHGPKDMPEQQINTKVRAITSLAPDTLLLHLQTPRTDRLRFLAGQSISLGLTSTDNFECSTYPVASCPCDDRNLHLYIARNPDDAFATALFSGSVKPGETVTVWGPSGEFVHVESSRPLVFVACDTAFVPAKSLIEHAMAVDVAPTISLYWLATRRDVHFLANQCRAWSAALDQFEHTLYTDADAVAGARQIAAAMRVDLLVIQCDFYLAGPAGFVATLEEELRAGGVPGSQIFTYSTDR